MNRNKKLYSNLAALCCLALVPILFFYSCDTKSQLASHSNEAQIDLNTVFITSPSTGPKGNAEKITSNLRQKGNDDLRLMRLAQVVDRVTVTVINSDGETVANTNLDIVQTAQGKFAEGTLTIPVQGDRETFRIDVQAFENDNLAFAGNAQVTLSPEQVLTDPIVVTLQPLGGGDVQVTLTWNTATDQDLHVIDPSNTRIYFDNPSSSTGGTLDFDDTDGFGPENIFWPTGQAPNGLYKVQVVYFSGAGATRITVVVQRSDAPSQTFTRTITAENDTLDITEFNFTAGEPVFVSIDVQPPNSAIDIAETVQYSATGRSSDGSSENITTQVTWASSDSTVASITTGGLATGLKEGSTTISATLGNLGDEEILTVNAPQLQSIDVTPKDQAIDVDQNQQFTATGTFSDGSTSDVTNQVTWASSDPTVASITTSGLATGLKEGSTTISATQGNISGETTLTVNAPQLQSIDVTPKDQAIDIDQNQQFTATGTFSNGSTSDVTNQVTWASGDPTVASITTGGLATGLKEGKTTISATQGDVSNETTLTVNAPQLSGATLANLQAPLVQANDSNNCDIFGGPIGSLFDINFDYTDPDGDVTQGTVVTVDFTFSGGGTGSFDATSPGITGDGSSGTLSVGACFLFGDAANTNVTISVTVTDAGGSVSNTISTVAQRPQGGNSRPNLVANKLGLSLAPQAAVCRQR